MLGSVGKSNIPCYWRFDMNKIINIKTALKIDAKMKANIEASVIKKLNDDSCTFTYAVDAALIGGIVIESDDFVLDGSLKAKISDISSKINK